VVLEVKVKGSPQESSNQRPKLFLTLFVIYESDPAGELPMTPGFLKLSRRAHRCMLTIFFPSFFKLLS
jgi:hypothetical protein